MKRKGIEEVMQESEARERAILEAPLDRIITDDIRPYHPQCPHPRQKLCRDDR